MILLCLALLASLAAAPAAGAAEARVQLTVVDSLSGQGVEGAGVHLSAGAAAPSFRISTGADGRTRILLDSGRWTLDIAHGAYHRRSLRLIVGEADTSLVVRLRPVIYRMPERVAEAVAAPSRPGVIAISPVEVQRHPAPAPDPVRVLRTLPGVASGGDQAPSAYSVRGGSRDENTIVLEGITLDMPFLPGSGLAEVMSPVNGDLVEELRLHHGVVDADLETSLSSVLEVDYRQPDSLEIHAVAGGTRQALTVAATPYGARLLAGARRTDLGRMTRGLQVDGDFDPGHHDVQGTVTFGTGASRLRLFGLSSRTSYALQPAERVLRTNCSPGPSLPPRGPCDQLAGQASGQERFDTELDVLGARLRRRVGGLVVGFAASDVRRREGEATDRTYRADWIPKTFRAEPIERDWLRQRRASSGHLDLHRVDASLTLGPDGGEDWSVGAGIRRTRVDGNHRLADSLWIRDRVLPARFDGGDVERAPRDLHAFARSRWTAGRWTTDVETRVVRFDARDEWLGLPRLRLSRRMGDGHRWVLAGGLTAQPVLFRELLADEGTPRAQKGAEAVMELEGQAARSRWRASLFYRRGWDRVSYDMDEVTLRYSGRNDSRTRAVGGELSMRGQVGRSVGTLSYSWLRAEEDLDGDDPQGWQAAPTDQRHTISAYLEDRMQLRSTWLQASRFHIRLLYGSGFPFTPLVPVTDAQGEIIALQPGERHTRRDDPYIRFDIGLTQVLTLFGGELEVREEVANLFDEFNAVGYQQLPTPQGMELLPRGLGRRVINVEVSLRL